MPSSRRDHAIGAIGNSQTAKHTRRMIAREKRDSHKPDPLAPEVPRCIQDGLCRRGAHTGVVGCTSPPGRHNVRCWCGEPVEHPWPGKDDGAPHPR